MQRVSGTCMYVHGIRSAIAKIIINLSTVSRYNITIVHYYRLKMYGFWNEESRLAPDTLGRLTQLLAVLYSTNTERQFLYHSTNLLLELTSRSPDFTRSIFDSPLSECKFEVRIAIHVQHCCNACVNGGRGQME